MEDELSGVLVAVNTHADDGYPLDLLVAVQGLPCASESDMGEETIYSRRAAQLPVSVNEELTSHVLDDRSTNALGTRLYEGGILLLRTRFPSHHEGYEDLVWGHRR